MTKIKIIQDAEIETRFIHDNTEDWEVMTDVTEGRCETFKGYGCTEDGNEVTILWKPIEEEVKNEDWSYAANWDCFWVLEDYKVVGTEKDFELIN